MATETSSVRSSSAIWRMLTSDRGAQWTARLLALGIWQVLSDRVVDRLPSPRETIEIMVLEYQNGDLITNILVSYRRVGTTLAIVLVLGILIGSAMGKWMPARYYFKDIVFILVSLPGFIWALLSVMWWGFSDKGPIVVGVLVATPILAINAYQGAQAVPANLRAMSRAYRVPLRREFRSLTLRSMSEYLFAGFRICVLAGFGGVLLTEWFGNSEGIGFRQHYWYDGNNFNGMLGWGIVEILTIVAIDRFLFDPLLRRLRAWRVGGEEWSG